MIIVCSLSDHKHVCESVKADHLISVIDPGYEPKTPTNIKYNLKLGYDDIIEINENNIIHRENETLTNFESITKSILPNKNHISRIVDFVSKWDQKKPIVIHCWCGVSRSMAVAIFLLCKLNPNNINNNVKYMRHIAPHANPNKLMLSLFEKNLGIDGKISQAFTLHPYTVTYDCNINFAPVTIFKINEVKEFE